MKNQGISFQTKSGHPDIQKHVGVHTKALNGVNIRKT